MLFQQLLLCIAFADEVGVEALLERIFAVAAAVDSFVRTVSADYCEEVYFLSDLSRRNREDVLDFFRLVQNSANSRKMNSGLW